MIKLTLIGLVINIKNNKTALVSVRKQFKHKLYKKVLFKNKHYMIHDEMNLCSLGDLILFEQSAPYSHSKKWILKKILKINK